MPAIYNNWIDLAVFLICFVLFWRSPLGLLALYLATVPYIGGNYIGTLLIPYSPSKAAGFALVALFFAKKKTASIDRHIFAIVLFALLLSLVRTIIGLWEIDRFIPAQTIQQFTQTPTERAIRSFLGECLFWLLPLAGVSFLQSRYDVRRITKVAFYSGIVYGCLGMFQFLSWGLAGYDPFGISRRDVITGQLISQSLVYGGFLGRITSICGEPRYLSTYSAIWLVVSLMFARQLGLSGGRKSLYAALFAACIILSGSRSGLFAAGLALVISLVAGVRYRRIQGSAFFAIFLLAVGVAGIFRYMGGDVVLVGRVTLRAESLKGPRVPGIALGPLVVPVEPYEYSTLEALRVYRWANFVGFGSGLWQYYSKVTKDPLIRDVFRLTEGATLTSNKPNVNLFTAYLNYGIVGLIFVFAVYQCVYRGQVFSRERLPDQHTRFVFWCFIALVQLTRIAETYAHVLMFLLLAEQLHWSGGRHVQRIKALGRAAMAPRVALPAADAAARVGG